MRRYNNTIGTRAYNYGAATRTAFSSTSSAAVALGALSAEREIMITATARCFLVFGASDVAAADGTAATNLPIEPGEKFHIRLPAGVTHYRVIRDTSDGVLNMFPTL